MIRRKQRVKTAERQAPDNTNGMRDIVLSPGNHRTGEDQEQEAEDVAEGNFEVGLANVGIEDQDIVALRRIEERLAAKMRERPLPVNIRTRAQAEAAILRAQEIQNEDPVQEKARYNEMLQQVKKKRMLL
jgi:hypothetical protein